MRAVQTPSRHEVRTRPLPAAFAALCALLVPAPALAAPEISLPAGAARTVSRSEGNATLLVPTAGWNGSGVPGSSVEGSVSRTAWRIPASEATSLDLIAPIRDQLAGKDFDILFECDAAACGGFDFRYALPVLPEPEMHVDLGDFRFLSARSADGAEHVVVLVSRTSTTGFVQIDVAGPAGAVDRSEFSTSGPADPPAAPVAAETASPVSAPAGAPGLVAALTADGRVALDDLLFQSGSAELGAGEFASLVALASWLKDNPAARVTLVGHTDALGPLAVNVSISRQRAQSVAERLAERYGVDPAQLQAEGVGFLAPRASNLTPEGRDRNRRVEAMLTVAP